jgi:hypothetical protein
MKLMILKTSQKMKTLEINRELARKFKRSYAYKMGGKQTVVMPDGQRFDFDDREYYSGRGSKYNASINHHLLGDVLVSNAELKKVVKEIHERAKMIKMREKENKATQLRITKAAKEGIYSLRVLEYGTFVELSDNEIYGQFFDAKRLANTLKISLQDAELLNSNGKTYVFAKSEDGKVYELYHSSLICNNLSISINEASPERIAEFSPSEWHGAPYASLIGQTTNSNHFVC